MKINPNYVQKKLLDEVIVVPTGNVVDEFNGIISTNEVAGFIWENLESSETPEDLIEKILENFDVDRETATKDTMEFLKTLQDVGMISNDIEL